MSVRIAWSAAEDDALLRAWADVVQRRSKSQAKELLQTYNALCDASVRQERTSAALQTRRNMFLRMRDIICAFHAHMQQQKTTKQGDDKEDGSAAVTTTGGATSTAPAVPSALLPEEASQSKFSSDDWFKLTLGEQKRWFASLDTKSYPFHEIQRDHFERVEEIYELSEDHGRRDLTRRKATYTRPRAEKEEQEEQGQEGDDGDDDDVGDADDCHYGFARDPLSTAHIRAAIDRLKHKKTETTTMQPAQRRCYGGCIQPHRYRDGMPEKEDSDATTKAKAVDGGSGNANGGAVSDDGGHSDGGSSTESDDEILACWDENGEATVPRSPAIVTTDVKAESASSIKTLDEDPLEQQSGQQSPYKHVDNVVDPDLLELASILETQARHLGEMFRQTKKARKEESRGRRYIMKSIQLDCEERKKVLEDLKRRDEELQREREQWQVEKSNMKRELAQLREQMAAKHQEAPERPE